MELGRSVKPKKIVMKGSSAILMIRPPAKNRMSIETSDVARAFALARWNLLIIVIAVAVPTPLSPFWGGSSEGPWVFPLSVGAVWAAVAWWSGRSSAGQQASLLFSPGLLLLLDVLALTLILWVSGAAQNPFTMLYFVPMALSTLISQAWTWAVVGASVVGFLFLLRATVEEAGPHAQHDHFIHHVVGMAVALAVAGALVTYFVHRIAQTLAQKNEEIQRLNREQEQDRHVTSLGALAAGAAHELGTPLGTVQILVGELPYMDEAERREAAQTIEKEVQRMKSILHQMTSSQLSAQVLAEPVAWSLKEWAEQLRAEYAGRVQVVCETERMTNQPRAILCQIVRELIQNAWRSSQDWQRAGVRVQLREQGEGFFCTVTDQGPGMSKEQAARAVEAFVSDSGGRGLGLFLAQVHTRQLGGRFELSSQEGQGTRVALWFPLLQPDLTSERSG